MRIVILGAGVLGVTAAYYLARDGAEVTVLERQAGAGRETSFANAAQVSADSAGPWLAPGMPWQALKWLTQRDAPFVLRWRKLDLQLMDWLLRAWINCGRRRYERNRELTYRIGRYSRECLQALREELGIGYDAERAGILQLFREGPQLEEFRRELPQLSAWGVRYRELDRAGCIEAEPALAEARAELAGGLLFPDDESGDCRLFSERLAERAVAAGARFEYGRVITELERSDGRIQAVRTQDDRYPADAVVVALGSYSRPLLESIGLRAPIYPVKGYTITQPLADPAQGPRLSITDEGRRVVISRLGDSLRAAGTVDLAGFDTTVDTRRCDLVGRIVEQWYPGRGRADETRRWACLRPMTPDTLPLIGRHGYSNLFLNTGHGSLGWTMACGSSRALADAIAGRQPELDLRGFDPGRF